MRQLVAWLRLRRRGSLTNEMRMHLARLAGYTGRNDNFMDYLRPSSQPLASHGKVWGMYRPTFWKYRSRNSSKFA